MCLEDILEELGEIGEKMRPAALKDTAISNEPTEPEPTLFSEQSHSRHSRQGLSSSNLSENHRRVYDAIPREPIFQDAVLAASKLPPGEVLAAFTALELKGLIKRLPGQLVTRTGAG